MAESRRKVPARTPELREKRLVSMAVDLAEQRLADGTASTQLISQLLRLATSQSKLEIERLKNENELLKAKVKKYNNDSISSEKYNEVIDAMRNYRGEDIVYEGE